MATRRTKRTKQASKRSVKKEEKVMPQWLMEKPVVSAPTSGAMVEEGTLDPGEEKMLDWILKGVVGFILAWLGLSVLLVVGGLFHLWK